MIFDLLKDTPSPEEMADVCVVGSGAAGICLALELSRQGKRVTLLEGGGQAYEEAAQEPYQSQVTGQAHHGIHVGRFRVYGGTTTRWGGQIRELDVEDFSRRDWVPGSGWPFSRQDLAPYYSRALEVEDVAGAIGSDAAVWPALHLKPPALPHMEPFFTRWCPEPNFARRHGQTLKESELIRVWVHANAVELDLRDGTVRSVRCRTQAGQEASFRAQQFVFCLGSIESVRFFLQPRESGLPWNESGLLGKYFQDHLDVDAADVEVVNRKRFHAAFDNVAIGRYKYHPKMRLTLPEQQRLRVLNCAATMHFLGNSDDLVVGLKTTAQHMVRGRFDQIRGSDVLKMVRHAPLLMRHSWRYVVQHRAYNSPSFGVRLRVHCEQEPLSGSTITLGDERDSLGLLRTRLDWKISDEELRSIREFTRLAEEALAGVGKVTPAPETLEGSEALRAVCGDSSHHMGGMRMDSSAQRGVVDPELRLHGTANCYVCSGAVFPTSGFSNPTHTVLALAVRLADHLCRQ